MSHWLTNLVANHILFDPNVFTHFGLFAIHLCLCVDASCRSATVRSINQSLYDILHSLPLISTLKAQSTFLFSICNLDYYCHSNIKRCGLKISALKCRWHVLLVLWLTMWACCVDGSCLGMSDRIGILGILRSINPLSSSSLLILHGSRIGFVVCQA